MTCDMQGPFAMVWYLQTLEAVPTLTRSPSLRETSLFTSAVSSPLTKVLSFEPTSWGGRKELVDQERTGYQGQISKVHKLLQ